MPVEREHRLFNAVLTIALLLALVAPWLARLESDTRVLDVALPPCAVLATTGHPCVTCGITRSILALYDGRWDDAWATNSGGVTLIALMLFELASRLLWMKLSMLRSVLWWDLGQLVGTLAMWRVSLG